MSEDDRREWQARKALNRALKALEDVKKKNVSPCMIEAAEKKASKCIRRLEKVLSEDRTFRHKIVRDGRVFYCTTVIKGGKVRLCIDIECGDSNAD
jgi:lipopolysaccharide biosynthesis regulator YciM